MEANTRIEPPELQQQAQEAAERAGMTYDEFVSVAVRKEIARRALAKIKREGEANRRGMSDDQVDETVNQAVQDYRREQRSR